MKIEQEQTLEGEITQIVEEAVFVDVGAAHDVVIPKVDIDKVKGNPSVNLAVGKTVPVYIYHTPQNGGNPLGSMAHALGIENHLPGQANPPDPWVDIETEYQEGDTLEGVVKRIKKYGAFVELPNGIDGLIHVSEMEPGFTSSPWEVVNPGEKVQVRILRIEANRKRISLSMLDTDQSDNTREGKEQIR